MGRAKRSVRTSVGKKAPKKKLHVDEGRPQESCSEWSNIENTSAEIGAV